jgi:transcription antitermination factor NusG
MPILLEEPQLFPPDLFDQSPAIDPLEGESLAVEDHDEEDRRWWVIYTKARQEKALARHLDSHKVPFFLPLIAHRRTVRKRNVESFLPMFTGYLFFRGTDDERVTALTSNRISTMIPVDDQQQLFTDLRHVHLAIVSGEKLTVESRIQAGQRVRVKSGALAGMEGKVIQRRGAQQRLLVAVNYLQQGVSIEIDDFMVEPI